MTTTTRRTFVGAATALGATLAIPQLVLGKQDAATPASEGEAAAPSLLAGLGLPEFTVAVTNDGLEFEPEATAVVSRPAHAEPLQRRDHTDARLPG